MSRRALAALLALVAALGLVVLFDCPAARFAPRDERLFPELTGGSVSRLTLQRGGGPAVIVERRAAGWTVDGAPADEAAVRELVDTLASLAVRLQVPPAAARGLDPPRLMVELTGGSGTHRLAIGDPDPALGRAWARRLEDPAVDLQIDGYAARALDRDASSLRRRAPFGEALEPRRIELSAAGRPLVQLRGAPPCVVAPAPISACALADPRRVAALLESLADLRVSRFLPAAPAPVGEAALRVDVDDAWLDVTARVPAPKLTARSVRSSVRPACRPRSSPRCSPRRASRWRGSSAGSAPSAPPTSTPSPPVAWSWCGAVPAGGKARPSCPPTRCASGSTPCCRSRARRAGPNYRRVSSGRSLSAPALILGAGDRRERAVLLDGPAGPEVRARASPCCWPWRRRSAAAGSWIARSSLTGGSSTSIPPPSRPSSSPTPRVPWSASRAARPSTTGG